MNGTAAKSRIAGGIGVRAFRDTYGNRPVTTRIPVVVTIIKSESLYLLTGVIAAVALVAPYVKIVASNHLKAIFAVGSPRRG